LTKESQDRELRSIKAELDSMLDMEQKISSEYISGVSQMEEKLLSMSELMNTTLEQLKENTRQLAQYKVRLQTLKIRIKIENKVRDANKAAKFEERYTHLERTVTQAQQR